MIFRARALAALLILAAGEHGKPADDVAVDGRAVPAGRHHRRLP
ncbi:MAG TPA: hypothetical protein PKJ98_16045 [Verrucomicrobiota bacterium]|nr:hypothetical protein [Verrucomicrobiota bacterium]